MPLSESPAAWPPATALTTESGQAARLLQAARFIVDALGPGELAVHSPTRTDHLIVLALSGAGSVRLDAIRAAAGRHPGAPLLATMPADARGPMLRRALHAGAHGVVLDDDLPTALVPTAYAVLAGQLTVPRALRRQIAPRALSHREKQILGFVVQGYTNAQIAHALFVAESTVKTHLSSAFMKLETSSRAETATLILDPEEGFGLGILGSPGTGS